MDPAYITSAGADALYPVEETRTTPVSVAALVSGQAANLGSGRSLQTRSGNEDSQSYHRCSASVSSGSGAIATLPARSRTGTQDGAESPAGAGTEQCTTTSDATRATSGTGMSTLASSSCCRDTAQSRDDGGPDRGEEEEDEAASASGAAAGVSSGRPSRHLWLGNLLQRANHGDVEAVFGLFGPVESVRVFPSRPSSYGFVNYPTVEAAMAAKSALEGRPAPSLTGPKPLLIRYQQPTQHTHHPTRQRPQPAQPRGPQPSASSLLPPSLLAAYPTLADAMAGPGGPGGRNRSHSTSSSIPVRRPHSFAADPSAAAGGGAATGPTSGSAEFLQFPGSEDFLPGSAMRPADAAAAVAAAALESEATLAALLSRLNGLGLDLDGLDADSHSSTNSGSRAVASAPIPPAAAVAAAAAAAAGAAAGARNVRSSSSSGRLEEAEGAQHGQHGPPPQELATSRHLWLGNMLATADVAAVEQAFTRFGPLESIRLFPERNFAFVNFLSAECASAAKVTLHGRPLPSLTGAKPMEIRFQTRPPHHMHLVATRTGGPSSGSSSLTGLLHPRRASHPHSPPLGDGLSSQLADPAPEALQPRLRSLLQLQLQPASAAAADAAAATTARGGQVAGVVAPGGTFSSGSHLPVRSALSGHNSPPVGDLDPATVMATTPPYHYMYGAAALAHAQPPRPHPHPHAHEAAAAAAQHVTGGGRLDLNALGMLMPQHAQHAQHGPAAADLAAMSRAAQSQLLQALALEPRGGGPGGADPGSGWPMMMDAPGGANWAGVLAAAATANRNAVPGPVGPQGWEGCWGLDGFAAGQAPAAGGAPTSGVWPAAAALAAARMSAPEAQMQMQTPGGAPPHAPLWPLGGSGGGAQQDPQLMALAAWFQQEQQQQQNAQHAAQQAQHAAQHAAQQQQVAAAARGRALATALFTYQQQQQQQQQQAAVAAAAAAAAAAGVDALLQQQPGRTGDGADGMLPGMLLPQHYRC